MMLLLYSWFIFDVYTISCPYKDANSTTHKDGAISFRSFYDDIGEPIYHHSFPNFDYKPTTTRSPPLPHLPSPKPQDGDDPQKTPLPTPMSCVPMHSKFIATILIIYAFYIVVKELWQLYHREIFYSHQTKLWQLMDGILMAVNCGSIFVHGDELKDWRYTVAGVSSSHFVLPSKSRF